jgi:hypothetical protein
MSISIEQRELFGRKYDAFNCLLLYFLTATYLPPEEAHDLKTIQKYVATFDKDALTETIKQANEVLSLDVFPAEWVGETTNRYPFDKSLESTAEDYHVWVQWMVKALEAEGRKVGKI